VLATHREGPAYHLEIGLEPLRAMLARGIHAVLGAAGLGAQDLDFAFLGIPAYGEDSALRTILDAIAAPVLAPQRYRCDNDMVCGWAGALGASDGINIVCGTGSIAYGEFEGRTARAGGWGELFSDEGSAYWVARQALGLFARMSDGRLPRGPIHAALRTHFGLDDDLDLCARIYNQGASWRSEVAALARIVARVALEGDPVAAAIFSEGAAELAVIIAATRARLAVPDARRIRVSYSGGMFAEPRLMLAPLRELLERRGAFELVAPLLPPGPGAALYAARCRGMPLSATAVQRLAAQYAASASA
jgi:N-acetylglucosamine kinase-like BadF-type ATPase